MGCAVGEGHGGAAGSLPNRTGIVELLSAAAARPALSGGSPRR